MEDGGGIAQATIIIPGMIEESAGDDDVQRIRGDQVHEDERPQTTRPSGIDVETTTILIIEGDGDIPSDPLPRKLEEDEEEGDEEDLVAEMLVILPQGLHLLRRTCHHVLEWSVTTMMERLFLHNMVQQKLKRHNQPLVLQEKEAALLLVMMIR